MKAIHCLAACGALLLAGAVSAQPSPHAGNMAHMPMGDASASAQAAAPALAEGEVIKVDPKTQTVTLKHGEIKNLSMPPMTMDYHVQDAAVFARLKPGSKIHFTAGLVNGAYTVLTVEDSH